MDTSTTTNGEGERFYLISAFWVRNMLNFVNKFQKGNSSDKSFERNTVLRLYFNDDEFTKSHHVGVYPGPINNFHIIDFKEMMKNPNKPYTNTYIKNGMKENIDYFYVNEKDWNLLKAQFGVNYEIERRTANLMGNILIEVNLRKVNYS
jgi:hypothetical protein